MSILSTRDQELPLATRGPRVNEIQPSAAEIPRAVPGFIRNREAFFKIAQRMFRSRQRWKISAPSKASAAQGRKIRAERRDPSIRPDVPRLLRRGQFGLSPGFSGAHVVGTRFGSYSLAENHVQAIGIDQNRRRQAVQDRKRRSAAKPPYFGGIDVITCEHDRASDGPPLLCLVLHRQSAERLPPKCFLNSP